MNGPESCPKRNNNSLAHLHVFSEGTWWTEPRLSGPVPLPVPLSWLSAVFPEERLVYSCGSPVRAAWHVATGVSRPATHCMFAVCWALRSLPTSVQTTTFPGGQASPHFTDDQQGTQMLRDSPRFPTLTPPSSRENIPSCPSDSGEGVCGERQGPPADSQSPSHLSFSLLHGSGGGASPKGAREAPGQEVLGSTYDPSTH